MAAEIQPRPQARKPCLLSKIEAFQEVVTAAAIIPKEDGVISVSEDRTIRVWLKRDSGQYWPSVYHTMPSSCSCMSFNPETRRISVGMDTGSICEFILSEDYNKMTPALTYQAHQGRVAVVLFVLEMEWLLSTGQDRNFTWHCSESGQQLGTYRTAAWVSGLQFDVETRHAFVGDQSGQVTILKLEQDSCSLVTTFKGHTGNVTALCWDPAQRVLFSGSSDHSIIMWDIGGRKGTAIELQGHNDKVQGLCYASHTRQLISCSSDGSIVIWNMDVTRQETPEWLDSDSCQKCEQPFFWNFKQMWDSKKIGLRQHHCRKCGQAVCGKCSSKRSTIPLMGFEFEVRVCDSCHESITDEDRAPTATFHDSKHNIVYMHYEPTTGNLLTSGTDKVVKVCTGDDEFSTL
uniref:WD repeat and FYVE domain containing 2 n=1 Tax=Xiphophorus maculatus TaxID=8083 RepID=A0A3B5PY42_XIPMA